MALPNLPTAGAGMISVADAEILLSQVDQRYMDMYNQISGSELINWVEGLFETYPMSMDTLRLPWQEVMDGFREWEGADKFFEGLIVRDMTVKTRPFEKSLQIDRRQGMQAILSRIISLTDNLSRAVVLFKPRLLARALLDGETGGASFKGFKFYDGKPAFATDHPINIDGDPADVWSNLYTGFPLNLGNLEEAIHDFSKVRSPDGESLGCMPTDLIVPGTLSQTARRLCENQTIGRLLKDTVNAAAAAGETNFRAGEIKPRVAHQLTAGFPKLKIPGEPNSWYLVDRSPGRKPFTYFTLQEPADMPENGLIRGSTPMVSYGKEASASMVITQPWFVQKRKG